MGFGRNRSSNRIRPISPESLRAVPGILTNLQAGPRRISAPALSNLPQSSESSGGLDAINAFLGRDYDDSKIFDQYAQRGLQSMRASRAGTGLLTSGDQEAKEQQFLEGLANTFGERAFERGAQRAAFGQSELSRLFGEGMAREQTGFEQRMARAEFRQQQEAQALEALKAALAAILGQSTTGRSSSSGFSLSI